MQHTLQPRVLMIDEQQCILRALVDQIEQTSCQIIRCVNREQMSLQSVIQRNQPFVLCLIYLPIAGRRERALLSFLKHWLPKALMVVTTTDTDVAATFHAEGADIVCGANTASQQVQCYVDRIAQHMKDARPRLVRKKRVVVLNERQQQILDHLAEGKSNKEISRTVYLSEGTVKNHITAIFNYLGVSNRTQAAIKVSRRSAVAGR